MSTTTQNLATQACFPSQQAIIEYFNSHPLKITGSFESLVVKSHAPDGIEKVAKCFADKTMPHGSIENGVKEALTDHEEEKKLAKLETALGKLLLSCEQIDAGKPSDFTLSMKQIHKNVQDIQDPDPWFDLVVKMHVHVLKDLLDRATYTPPKEGEKSWTRHVADLTKKETPLGQLNLDKGFV
jgi:hypothetical protein